MKIIRYDRGGVYYGRYDEIVQHPGPFAKLLQKRDICAQYTMLVHHNKRVYQKDVIDL